MELRLVLPVPISINALYMNEWGWNPKARKREPTGRRILTKEGEKSKKAIQEAAKHQLSQNEDNWNFEWTSDKGNFLFQDAVIFFSRKGRDDNNLYKLLNDSLEGIIYDNDSRVLVRTQKILYDKSNPRIELTIRPVDYVGVFNSVKDCVEFEKNCMKCTRYLDGRCSILNDSKLAVVREEILFDNNNIVCSKYKEKKS